MTQPDNQRQLLADVLATFARCPDARLRQIMEAVVRHLHQLVAEVGLTREEWATAVAFLTAVGHTCDDRRQEFVLLSDTLGVSSLVEMVNYPDARGATENTVVGPFYVPGSPERGLGESIVVDEGSGEPLVVSGTVRSLDGTPLPGATLDIWETAASGRYAVQDPDGQHAETCVVFSMPAQADISSSAPSGRWSTRSPTTGRSARCFERPAATPCGPPMCTCGFRPPVTASSSPTSSTPTRTTSTPTPSSGYVDPWSSPSNAPRPAIWRPASMSS